MLSQFPKKGKDLGRYFPRNGRVVDAVKISVIIPFRNSEQTIRSTLNALNMQEFQCKVELILIDDHSTDSTMSVVEGHPISKGWVVKHIVNEVGGLANAYNLGIHSSEGEICLLCHADCYTSEKDVFNKILIAFSNPKVVLAYTLITLPFEDWGKMSFWDKVGNARFVGKMRPTCGGKFTAVRRSAIMRVGWYDSSRFHSAGEDVDMQIRLASIGCFVSLGVRTIHGHLYPQRNGIKFLIRKQIQLGQGFGAILRKYGMYPGSMGTIALHALKLILLVCCFLPVLCFPSLICLCVFAGGYSMKAFWVNDWRVIAIIPINILQFTAFLFAAISGFVHGKQGFYYK